MNAERLETLYQHYYSQLKECYPGFQHLLLLSRQGDVIWNDSELPVGPVDEIREVLLDKEKLTPSFTASNHHVELFSDLDRNYNPIGFVALLARESVKPKDTRAAHSIVKLLFTTLGVIHRYIDDIDQQDKEIDSLAAELAGRYEELNLVYSSDSNALIPALGRNALHEIVSNAATFMDVDAATLLFPDKGLEITQTQQDDKISQLGMLIERLNSTFFEYIKKHQDPLVINNQHDLRSCGIYIDIKCKLVIQPLVNFDHNTIGMLALINCDDRHDFTNSDRNLCGVLASKATTIVLQNFDPLTGLENATSFDAVLQEAFRQTRKNNEIHAVAKINVDRLAVVNDLGGHKRGDDLLKKIGQILSSSIRSKDTVARMAGDSFGILLRNCSLQQARIIMEKISKSVAEIELRIDRQIIDCSISTGLGPLNADVNNVSSIYSNLESALAEAKQHGRNNLVAYEVDDEYLLMRKDQLKWVSITQTALHENRFEVFGQPIVSLSGDDKGPHYEVLVRMLDESGDLVQPNQFIPVAENYFLMSQIDRWVINRSLKLLSDHLADHADQPIAISVNLSGQSIVERDLFDYIKERFKHYNIPPDLIRFEITESAAIANLADAQSFINRITRLGCQFALDDFGSGYSSFSYLKNLNVDFLKIDGSFVRQIVEDPVSTSMVSAINDVGHAMQIKTIAEFVEDESIIHALEDLHVDYAQGYAFAKPKPLTQCLQQTESQGND